MQTPDKLRALAYSKRYIGALPNSPLMLLGRAGRCSALDAHTVGVVPDLALCVVNQPLSREDTLSVFVPSMYCQIAPQDSTR